MVYILNLNCPFVFVYSGLTGRMVRVPDLELKYSNTQDSNPIPAMKFQDYICLNLYTGSP